MKQDAQVTLRLPAGLVARLDALIPVLEQKPQIAAMGKVTRSKAARLALLRGLDALEREHG